MSSSSTQPKVIVLAGPTAVGKSAAAKYLVEKLHIDAEIIIGDSVQVYKCMDIGSNKPTKDEQALVPHHLIDIKVPKEPMSAADFVQHATPIIFDILKRNKVPIIVGGSTMWLQWLVHGTPDAPKASEEAIRERERLIGHLERDQDWFEAVDVVSRYDAIRVKKLPKNDWYRLRRCLEVALTTQKQEDKKDSGDGNDNSDILTGERKAPLKDFDVRGFFLSENREALYRVIDNRCEEMLMDSSSIVPITLPGNEELKLWGLFGETTRLLMENMLDIDSTVAKAIGYRQTIQYLCRQNYEEGDIEALVSYVDNFATVTRNYAQKQFKWYRKDDAFIWLQVDRSHENTIQKVSEELVHWLNQDRNHFDDAIKFQMDVGKAVQELRNDKRLLHEYNCKPKEDLDEVYRQAVQYLKDYKSFSKDDIGRDQDPIDRDEKRRKIEEISAYNTGIRSSEAINSKALRTYVSQSPLLMKMPSNSSKGKKLINSPTKQQLNRRTEALRNLCSYADKCAIILRTHRPDIIDAVAQSTEGGIHAEMLPADDCG